MSELVSEKRREEIRKEIENQYELDKETLHRQFVKDIDETHAEDFSE